MSQQSAETPLPEAITELIQRLAGPLARAVSSARCRYCSDVRLCEHSLARAVEHATVGMTTIARAAQAHGAEQERARLHEEDPDDLHTGDDDLLDALTSARVAIESILEGDEDPAEAAQDALDALTEADEIRVRELRLSPADATPKDTGR